MPGRLTQEAGCKLVQQSAHVSRSDEQVTIGVGTMDVMIANSPFQSTRQIGQALQFTAAELPASEWAAPTVDALMG
jgi:hypothetical protein